MIENLPKDFNQVFVFVFVCILVTEPEPECDFPEPTGNGDISDDGMPDMGEVSTVTYSCSKQ